ncbi:S-adenosylmethionine:tRNA ribosyltransferase-isomerase [Flaviaesturariibacter amylovorans]|uniref:S-adenosylmethionine:tRNA ribosyltransferase-isomerase n=1 Tax=Flaviaesturariibacter amylovorans TaxID=1084520 RepID=A0ABP8HCK8_9BACT
MEDLLIEQYDYPLPDHRIAAQPLSRRDASRLLVYRNGAITDSRFTELPHFLTPGGRIFLNDTRVIEARLFFQKETGGIIELFCLEPYEPAEMTAALGAEGRVRWRCLVGGASKWKHGLVLEKPLTVGGVEVRLQALFISKEPEDFIIELRWNSSHHFAEILHVAGNIPLPPYIKRAAAETDAERYQTIFARQEGSVAAPTAALHFSPEVMEGLAAREIRPRYITLNVGAGTFKPVKADTISGHVMHGEHFTVTRAALQDLRREGPLVAVGTTTLRTLESLYWLGVKNAGRTGFDGNLDQWEAYDLDGDRSYAEALSVLEARLDATGASELHCRTSLLIRPGYRFRSADALVTNFHQPRSTLLFLVAAFIGPGWEKVYRHALDNDYRFLSYGDSSLLFREG